MATTSDFDRLAMQWDAETAFLSNGYTIMQHAACREIALMGFEAVPWILQRLATGHIRHAWSMLLREITGETPGPPPASVLGGHFEKYDVEATAQAWLAWGEAHGYLV